MHPLLRRALGRPARPAARPPARPRLEALEGRECPAATRPYTVIARTGDLGTTGLGSGPSINDAGQVALVGTFATGQGVLVRALDHGPLTNVTPGFQSASRSFGQSVEINAGGRVAAVDRTTQGGGTITLLRLWDAAHPAANTVLSRASSPRIPQDDDFDIILNNVAVNRDGAVAFAGLDNDLPVEQSVVLTRNAGGTNRTLANLPAPQALRPQIADTADVVVRAGTRATDPILLYPAAGGPVTIAGPPDFAALGQAPGVGPDGRVVAFYGDLTAAGAAAISAAQPAYTPLAAGPGVFASVTTATHGRVLVRVAAAGGPGATAVATFDANTRVGVNSAGAGAAVTVVFMGLDAGGHDGVYSDRLAFAGGAADPTGFTPGPAKLIVQTGDSVTGVAGAIQSVNIYDPVDAKGDVVFWTNHGGGVNAVVVADPAPPVAPTKVTPKANGSLVVTYRVSVAVPAGQQVPVGVYWGDGPTGPDALPDGPARALFTYQVGPHRVGTYKFTVPAAELLTAPPEATHLLVVADPDRNLGDQGDPNALLPVAARTGALTAGQLQKAMPGLSAADAARYAGPLSDAMARSGVTGLEQRAMFLGQLAHESNNLRAWVEGNGKKPDGYFVGLYWTRQKNGVFTRFRGLGRSEPTKDGFVLRVPHAAGAPKEYELWWRGKDAGNPGASADIGPVTFAQDPKVKGYYRATFAGAAPATLPAYATHLEVVDPDTGDVVLSIEGVKLRNWRVRDVLDYRGRGPIQLTGRWNYQRFADAVGRPDVMTDPARVSDSADPALGFLSAGWFWQRGNDANQDLNPTADGFAFRDSDAFTLEVSGVINAGTAWVAAPGDVNGFGDRLRRYRVARLALLDTEAAG